MMASMLSAAPANPPGRMSQLLPSVKCSNCNNPVPLAELGEHICAPAPPVPALPSATTTKPLGLRLQSLVSSPKPNSIPLPASPGPGPSRSTTPQPAPAKPQAQHRPTPSTSSERSRKTSTSSLSPFPSKSNPFARPDRSGATSPGHSPTVSSPLRDRAPSTASSMDYRTRTISTASSGSTPSTARPSFSSSRDTPSPTPTARGPSPRLPSPQPQSTPALQPQPHARAQPSISSIMEPSVDTKTGGEAGMAGVGRRGFAAAAHAAVFLAPTLQARRGTGPQPLDIHSSYSAASTPPLSAGSGYSSSTGPVSPQSQMTSPSKPSSQAYVADPTSSPVSPLEARMPFLDKMRSKLPGGGDTTPKTPTTPNRASSKSSKVQRTESTTSSRSIPVPPSPSSGSEYGLAYADSTDYEDDDDLDVDRQSLKGRNAPPPLPLTASPPKHRSSKSQALSSRENGQVKVKDGTSMHQKSSASVSSAAASDRDGRDKSNSSKIAHALGLSQTPPTAYGKMGSPPMRSGRALSTSSNGSKYSRASSVSSGAGLGAIASTSSVLMNGRLERAMETLLEDVESSKTRPSLLKSKSTGKQAYFERKEDEDHLGVGSPSTVSKSLPTRSNTVGVPYSPDSKTVKLPARAKTERSNESLRRPSKRVKTCVRCEKRIEDGRWIQVDSGGILCERCWKNMYLPKCRRCDLPIEKQAVSSSDGQLKGKYHKDCFNCHTCHEPFPDRTFYVFDGRPLCAYHYHEANRSLCAATSCGQPIEGPCAVSHTGARYHPEHLFCEFTGCEEKLEEYWEVDGMMLCQRHARWGEQINDADSKATKRVTRFIDLSGGELGLR